jgi:two-component system cell cycle response regulator DivK
VTTSRRKLTVCFTSYSQAKVRLSEVEKHRKLLSISARSDTCRERMIEKDSTDRTVLVVEDGEDARYLMRLELERFGYLVIEAEDGKQAVEVAQRDRPDIILMDLSLPIMDGFAATEIIRASDGLEAVPIIAVTAHQETDFRAGAKAAGFDAYVTKPIDINWLSELIQGLLA